MTGQAGNRPLRYTNALVFTPDRGFVSGGFCVEGECFAALFSGEQPGDVDLHGARVIPGLVDLHIHGAAGADFSDGKGEGLRRMGEYLAACGVTSFVPTAMSLPDEALAAAFETAAALRRQEPPRCARIAGVRMEGPFFSPARRGAQNGAYLRLPDKKAFLSLCASAGGLLRIVDLAPELPGAVDFIRLAAKRCTVSLGHTEADYEQARLALEAGARHLTHLFNAMPALHHRSPGPIGAAAEREDVTAELICDGLHVHPSMVRLAFRLFPGRICLISDALRCCGMPEGDYELSGQQVRLAGGVARLPDGTIAGAASNLYRDLRNAIAFGIPAEEAVRAATLTPARVLGAEGEIGSIAPGRKADFLVCGADWELQQVYLGGEALC